MALGRAFAVAIRGLDGITVEIEAHISGGLPGVHLVGLPDTALQESRDRVRAAITFPVKSACRTQLWFYIRPCSLHSARRQQTWDSANWRRENYASAPGSRRTDPNTKPAPLPSVGRGP